MTAVDLIRLYQGGEYVVDVQAAAPWTITHCSRASWYRFMKSPQAPSGMCLRLGTRWKLALGPFLDWISASPPGAGTCGHVSPEVGESATPAGDAAAAPGSPLGGGAASVEASDGNAP